MNRIDRLFAITMLLQSRGRLPARALAAHFEVSQRTIYRDIIALSESGVPIVALPGQGYDVAEGFFLPPVHLTTPEASALVLGARLLASAAAPALAQAATSAEAKIVSLLRDDARRYLHELGEGVDVSLAAAPRARLDLEDERVSALWRAILERRLVSLRYVGRHRAQGTARDVEPRRLRYAGGAWYLTAYCRLRAAERAFRLDRIEAFTVEPVRFRPRPARDAPPPTGIEVVVRFTASASRWVQERQHWSFTSASTVDGALVATYHPDQLEEIAAWILGWGTAAEALAPVPLRERLRAEAQGLVHLLT